MKKKIFGLVMTVALLSGLSFVSPNLENPNPSPTMVILNEHGDVPTG